MKVRVFKVFGREVLRIESHEEATLSDVISLLVAQRMKATDGEDQCECEEDFDPDEEDVDVRFHDMTERLVWDSKNDEEE